MVDWTSVENKMFQEKWESSLFVLISKSCKDNIRIKNYKLVSYGNFDGKILNKNIGKLK